MSLALTGALTGMPATYMVGAAGATNLLLQPVLAQSTPQARMFPQTVTTQQAGLAVALPATHELSTAALVAQDSLSAIQSPFELNQLTHEKQLADAVNVRSDQLWRLAARFLNPDAFTLQLTGIASKTDTKRAVPVRVKQHAAVNIPSQPTIKAPAEAEEVNHSDPAPVTQQRMSKTEIAVALTGDAVPVASVSLKLPLLPKASAATPVNESTTQAASGQNVQLKGSTVVTTATSPVKSIFPYSNAQLVHARVAISTAGVSAANAGERNSSELSRAKASDSCEVFRPHATPKHLRGIPPKNQRTTSKESLTPDKAPAHPFQRSQVVGPAFLVGNLEAKKAPESKSAQIVRIAATGTTKRRIVFAPVPGTRDEHRLVGIDHQQKAIRPQERGTTPALMTPYAERALHRSTLGLAPRSGSGSHAPAEPRELRADERERLVKSIQQQLAKGPAALDDDTVRTGLNEYLFSNGAGKLDPYEWTALLRASLLYAARAALPFSNNSIAQTAADQLFGDADVQSRYAEWTKHFGITGLSDITLLDTFADEDRLLTMPEYFLKGIMDYMIERAPELQGYDEDALPLPFTTELHLQWETIGFIHDPAISNDSQLIEAATAFTEEIAALDPYAAQHFLELVMLSTLVKTDSIQGAWNRDQAVALIEASIRAGLSDVIDPIGRNRSFPRPIGRIIAIAKESVNASEDKYRLGMDRLMVALDRAIQNDVFSIDKDDSEELRIN